MPSSRGDPRVLFAMNLVLSTLFCYVVVRGLDFLGVVGFSWPLVAGTTVALVIVTHLVTR